MSTKFFKCRRCGNVVIKTVDSGIPLSCCGEQMEEIVPNTQDLYAEKHLPVVIRLDDGTIRVKVGELPHPMNPDHSIRFILVETENGFSIRYLSLSDPSEANFCIPFEKVKAVYEYCNVHGLWMASMAGCCTGGGQCK